MSTIVLQTCVNLGNTSREPVIIQLLARYSLCADQDLTSRKNIAHTFSTMNYEVTE